MACPREISIVIKYIFTFLRGGLRSKIKFIPRPFCWNSVYAGIL